MADDQDITPAILLQHILAMRGDLTAQMNTMEQRLLHKMDDLRTELKGDIKEVKRDLARVEGNLSMQIGNLDERLDDLEVVKVPMLQKAVGMGGKAGRSVH